MAAGMLHAYEMQNGLAIVTSRKGKVELSENGKTPANASLHQVMELSSLKIVTDPNERIFLALSNGTALGIDENTELVIESFKQRPFPRAKESYDYEASNSELVLSLERGCLAVSANYLSPLSKINLRLPKGEVRLHSSSCHVKYDRNGVSLSVAEGNATYHYPDHEKREFILKGEFVRISDQSALRSERTELSDINTSLDAWSKKMLEATNHASRRVVFKVSDGSVAIPEPVLVAKPDALSQPSQRPYQYLD